MRCDVHNKEVREFLFRLAHKHGKCPSFKWYSENDWGEHRVGFMGVLHTYGPHAISTTKEVSLETLIAAICEPVLPKIEIGDYAVDFTEEGIQVGCTFVSKETVKEIYERLYNEN